MKVEDFMNKPNTEEQVPGGIRPELPQPEMPQLGVGGYAQAAKEMGVDAFMAQFPRNEEGKYLVPNDFIRETVQVAAIRLLSLLMTHPEITENEILPIAEGLHKVVDILNGDADSSPGELGNLVTTHLQALQNLMIKYGVEGPQ